MRTFPVVRHEADVCVVGGGMAGLCAASASARHGAKTLIMQDRPVFGGMASSEMRMHMCGAQVGGGPNLNHSNMRETGIVEELRLANQVYNPQLSWQVWSDILYDKAYTEPNLEYLLNCSCQDAFMDGNRIRADFRWRTGLHSTSIHIWTARVYLSPEWDNWPPCHMARRAHWPSTNT